MRSRSMGAENKCELQMLRKIPLYFLLFPVINITTYHSNLPAFIMVGNHLSAEGSFPLQPPL